MVARNWVPLEFTLTCDGDQSGLKITHKAFCYKDGHVMWEVLRLCEAFLCHRKDS